MDKSESYLAAPEHKECYEGLKKSYDLDKTIFSTYGLKKRKTSKDAAPATGPKAKESQFGYATDQEENLGNDDEEPKEKVASKRDWFHTNYTTSRNLLNTDWNLARTLQRMTKSNRLLSIHYERPKINNLTQETLLRPAFRLLKGTRSNYAELEYDFEECYKALSEKLDWENPEGGDYPFDLTKPLPLVMSGNHQKVPVDYFFNNDLKYLQGGVLTMTYTTSITKTKAAQYDLPGIKDMVPNIWVPVRVAYDKHALWGISQWREQRKTFYGYARGLQSIHDVYSMKHHLAVTRVEVMRKYGYRYLKDIVVRRADNDLYRFKEGDFPRLCINDIEDMLLLVVHNRLTNLSGDDVSDFAIALRLFT
ncbi:hypothetical protein Tco_0374071 [Tanacetum coccineum]